MTKSTEQARSHVTEDGFLNRRLTLRQPAKGFRAGLDAVMLAAAVPATEGEEALELGSGVGTASLCLALRTGACVRGIEIDPVLVGLSMENAALNAMAGRVTFEAGDALAPRGQRFAHVFTNPPFHDDSGQRSPNAGRARALQDSGSLKDWVRSGLEQVAAEGSFTIILRADRLREVRAVLPDSGITIFPLLPRAGVAPKRVIVQWRAGRTGAPVTREGLVLHTADGRYTVEADAILRGAAGLRIDA